MLLKLNERWKLHEGDCITHMLEDMPEKSVDMAVFSPPFPSLYAYSSETCDIGNSEDLNQDAKLHLRYFYKGLSRVLKPGRVAVVHVMQIPRLKRSGEVGLHDFRGLNIRLGERAGLVYEYDWLVRKNPQAQAIRTKSRELQFSGLESDRAKSRGTLGDYLIKFRAPGENAIPVNDGEIVYDDDGENPVGLKNLHYKQVSRNDWIEWAESAWYGIKETDTLNTRNAKSEDDVKHICPLQLPVINRLVRLYSNPGELVFSPFAGIGSEGYEAIKLGRRFYGCEIKPEYIAECKKNLTTATTLSQEKTLFDTEEAA